MSRKSFPWGLLSMFALDLATGLLVSATHIEGVLAGLAWLPVPILFGIGAVEIVSWAIARKV